MNEQNTADCTIYAGQVMGAHGVSGNIRLKLVGPNADVSAEALRTARVIKASRQEDGYEQNLVLLSLRRPVAKGGWLARFKDISNREGAEALFGCRLLVPETSLPTLPDGEYYIDQLVGLTVVTEAGQYLGKLTEVITTPANDVYSTSAGALIPAVAAFIKTIDLTAGRMTVADMPGLLQSEPT